MVDFLPDTLKEWLGDRPRPQPTLEDCIRSYRDDEPSKREKVRWCNRALLALARHSPGGYLLPLSEDLVRAASSGVATLEERWNLTVDSQINVARLQIVYEPDHLVSTLRGFSDLAEKGTCTPGNRWHLPTTFEHVSPSSAARARFQLLAAHSSIYSAVLVQREDWSDLISYAQSFVQRWPKASHRGISEPLETLAHTSTRRPPPPSTLEPHLIATNIIINAQFEIARIRRGNELNEDDLSRLTSQIHLHRDKFKFPDTVDAILTALAKSRSANVTETPSRNSKECARQESYGDELRSMIRGSLVQIRERKV